MKQLIRYALVATTAIVAAAPAAAQDLVRFREPAARGERMVTEARGKIESESLGGVKIGGRTIPAAAIVDVEYEAPGAIRLDVREARQAEDSRRADEAVRKFKALSASPAAGANKMLKRYFDFKVAAITATKADPTAAELAAAIDALNRFITEHPDAWQRVGATRLLVRLYLDAEPANMAAAKKALEDLAAAAAAGSAPDVKADALIAIVDLHLERGDREAARKALDSVPGNDPRVPAYRVAVAAEAGNLMDSLKKLEDMLANADDSLKATIYNLLGDCNRIDPKREKDALFDYLWVDLIYNTNPAETAKAQFHAAELFKKMNQDDRAKLYRDKARGRI